MFDADQHDISWSISNPLNEKLVEAMNKFLAGEFVSREERFLLGACVSDYIFFMNNSITTERLIKRLRKIRCEIKKAKICK